MFVYFINTFSICFTDTLNAVVENCSLHTSSLLEFILITNILCFECLFVSLKTLYEYAPTACLRIVLH